MSKALHSRFSCTEILEDDKKENPAGYWERANQALNTTGVTGSSWLVGN